MSDNNEATAWNGVMGGGNCAAPETAKDPKVSLAPAFILGAAIGTVTGGISALLGVRSSFKNIK